MSSVFVLQHETEDGDVKMIGVFSNKRDAESAIWRLKSVAGFSESPSGFSIDSYELNSIYWSEGFTGA
ncbi:MAG: hypothetical protein QNJ00_11185 [Woeseiaceae bacterium]|nr:hypothetical protein [Woeseiaceae bacterium]